MSHVEKIISTSKEISIFPEYDIEKLAKTNKERYYYEAASNKKLPVVLSSPHSGTEGIKVLEKSKNQDALLYVDPIFFYEFSQGVDWYMDDVVKSCTEIGSTGVISLYMRYLIELNKKKDQIEEITLNTPKVDFPVVWGNYLMIITTYGINQEYFYDKAISLRDLESKLIPSIYDPYHDILRENLIRLRDIFNYSILFDLHSAPDLLFGSSSADIALSTCEGISAPDYFLEAVQTHFESYGYEVALSLPGMKGGEITRRHSDPKENIFGVQIEVRRSKIHRMFTECEMGELYEIDLNRETESSKKSLEKIVGRELAAEIIRKDYKLYKNPETYYYKYDREFIKYVECIQGLVKICSDKILKR